MRAMMTWKTRLDYRPSVTEIFSLYFLHNLVVPSVNLEARTAFIVSKPTTTFYQAAANAASLDVLMRLKENVDWLC